MSESSEQVGARIRAAMAAGPPGPSIEDLLHHDIEGNPIPGHATLTLTDFLLARLAEDEAEARDHLDQGPEWVEECQRYGNDPARVLADVEAKRAIVAAWVDAVEVAANTSDHGPAEYADGLELAARLLAQPYRDHPDWREEWSA